MELIKPSEISARILTLIDESNEWLVLVSPYMKISKWYKLINKIKTLKSRNILLEIYVRDDRENTSTYRDLDQLSLQYKKVPHLHSKLYLNERNGIITSMNLLLSSEINSLEIGYSTDTWEEYNDLLGFYHRYIHTGQPVHCDTITSLPVTNLKEIIMDIREGLKGTTKNSWAWFAENAMHISTGRNNYIVSINEGYLRIAACLKIDSGVKQNGTQQSYLIEKKIAKKIARKVSHLTAKKIDVYPERIPGIIQLSGQTQHTLKSTCLTRILEAEAPYIIQSVVRFIDATDNLVIQEEAKL